MPMGRAWALKKNGKKYAVKCIFFPIIFPLSESPSPEGRKLIVQPRAEEICRYAAHGACSG